MAGNELIPPLADPRPVQREPLIVHVDSPSVTATVLDVWRYAEFIRELIVEGAHEGMEAARTCGVRLGRPPAMTPEQVRHARDLLARPNNSVASIARLLGVSRSTLYKVRPGTRWRPAADGGRGGPTGADATEPRITSPTRTRGRGCVPMPTRSPSYTCSAAQPGRLAATAHGCCTTHRGE
jgi:Helix-turn-helix domain of resolvase